MYATVAKRRGGEVGVGGGTSQLFKMSGVREECDGLKYHPGGLDGWMDRWMDGWMDKCYYLLEFPSPFFSNSTTVGWKCAGLLGHSTYINTFLPYVSNASSSSDG